MVIRKKKKNVLYKRTIKMFSEDIQEFCFIQFTLKMV